MNALFPEWTNSLYRVGIGLALVSIVLVPVLLMTWVRTPVVRGEKKPIIQPVDFDHRHHVRDDGIACSYCHYEAERSPYAGVPPTSLCMNCHSQIWNAADLLAPVRESYFNGLPLVWQRIYSVPDFVFFNHAIHVNRGVGCVTCHGRVDLMPSVYRVQSLTMGWCLDCHRNPAPHLRPLDEVQNLEWESKDQPEIARRLIRELGIKPPTDCWGCHR
jgi:hypothetical protein